MSKILHSLAFRARLAYLCEHLRIGKRKVHGDFLVRSSYVCFSSSPQLMFGKHAIATVQ